MKKNTTLKILSIILVALLSGCGSKDVPTVATIEDTVSVTADVLTESAVQLNAETTVASQAGQSESTTVETSVTTEATTVSSTTVSEQTTITEIEEESETLSEQQKNSFSMLYYLAITAEEISKSRDNRLMLDDIYTSLLNDINPGTIDERTQDHLQNLRDIIKSYRNISVKRDRLQYIYNQEKASTIKSTVPDPLAILSTTHSLDWRKFAISTVYTVVDSYNNYKTAEESVEQKFISSGWELDDEETATIQKNRDRAFDYMVDIVQEYDLDGTLTLNENAIRNFAEICAIDSVYQKIQRLESEEKTYQLLGNYWLELADCYYETAQYRKCLTCIEKYNELSTGIYRKDYSYVRVLPKAIVAAQNTYYGDEYVSKIEEFADAIIDNTETDEWSLRYFAAQTYIDLYSRTDDKEYLKKAYGIALDNVTILIDEQEALNATYLSEIQEQTLEEPDYRFLTEAEKKAKRDEYKKEQKLLKEYNSNLKEVRKTELPSLYEPLVLNCDLLFALAEKNGISYSEKEKIEQILKTEECGVFLSKPINEFFSFGTTNEKYSVFMEKDQVIIPAELLTSGCNISLTVTENGETITFNDYIIEKVDRENSDFSSFKAFFSSKQMKEHKWNANSKISISIDNGENYNPLIFNFKVADYDDMWILPDKVVFEAV